MIASHASQDSAVTAHDARPEVMGPSPPYNVLARGVRGPVPPIDGGPGPSPRYPVGQPTETVPTYTPEPLNRVSVRVHAQIPRRPAPREAGATADTARRPAVRSEDRPAP